MRFLVLIALAALATTCKGSSSPPKDGGIEWSPSDWMPNEPKQEVVDTGPDGPMCSFQMACPPGVLRLKACATDPTKPAFNKCGRECLECSGAGLPEVGCITPQGDSGFDWSCVKSCMDCRS